jgi:class 3 adenylate cyclase
VDPETGGTTKNMVCVAMSVNDAGPLRRLGVLQIVNKTTGDYTVRDVVLLEYFAAQSAVAIRKRQMFDSLVAHMGLYSARDPLEVVHELRRPPASGRLTLKFADMRGFTRLCQTIRNDKQICDLLSEFLTLLTDEVLAESGTVNKQLGDGILAVFRGGDSASRAVNCAFKMEDRFQELRANWKSSVAERIDFLDIGIGIVTAEVMLGAIGAGKLRDFTAIGTPVILASAFEKAARGGKRILSDRPTYKAVEDMVDDQVQPVEFPLHKPDQPTILAYDMYELRRRKPVAAAPGKPSIRAFLCHASEDKEQVGELYEKLRRDGIQAWLDKKDIKGGEEWKLVIEDSVRSSHVVLVCISSRSINKEGYLQKEIRCVLDVADEKPEGAIYVIPVRLENCDIPRQLKRWQAVDLFEAKGYEMLMRSLDDQAARLGAVAGR